ncbi:hypothetical protein ICN30_08155 [Polynucleobacter sp. 31A-FELB]|uniref:primase-helicase family protein n=1 Tax=Polynucleobacter sp. 31A-FELB TaxID=2689096 RepID=UPI001C0B1200|nr:primase-helicase family protein [Polynucleobacter sp. 31A-FELB]MBU3587804.1 hypothetical protein [Polynucleobacter sp. 31A-FELB]
MSAATFTKITILNPEKAGKTFSRVNSQLKKETVGYYSEADAYLQAVNTYDELKNELESCSANELILAGTSKQEHTKVRPKAKASSGQASRDAQSFPFGAAPGLLVIDTDEADKRASDGFESVANQLHDAVPELASYSMLHTTSTGANVIDANGEKLTGVTGIHTLFMIKDATDVPRALKALHQRLWLAGHGYIFIGVTGKAFDRSIVDLAMCESSQPLYMRAHLDPDMSQNKQFAIYEGELGDGLLDTKEVIKDLSQEELEHFNTLVARAKEDERDACSEKARTYSEEQVKKKEAQGLNHEEAVNLVASSLRNDLYEDVQICLSDGEIVTVGHILSDPQQYHHATCRDPLEWEYGGAQVAKIFSSQDKPLIQSFAHHGQTYFLHRGKPPTAQERREQQRQESVRIGQGERELLPEIFTLDQALERFVFLTDGSRVADINDPRFPMSKIDWDRYIAASKHDFIKDHKPKVGQVSEFWINGVTRKTATATTFKAGGKLFELDPHGRDCINTWKSFERSTQDFDCNRHGLGLFLDHVKFLFKEDAPRFLRWLAHIEQKPGELPHTSWLHVATNTGLGRNWMAAVLVRVWFGRVAAHLDLNHLLEGNFNGVVSGKILGIVDEIREGNSGNQYRFFEQLKKFTTEAQRLIRPKYGRESVEYNSCRMLYFSNHRAAIPIDHTDRRFEVVISEDKPRDADYFKTLYSALEDPMFIEAVARYLGALDISAFNAGDHARQSTGKKSVQDESKSALDEQMELILRRWPADVITAKQFASALQEESAEYAPNITTPAIRRTMERHGFRSLKKPCRITSSLDSLALKTKPERVIVLRNHEKYINQQGEANTSALVKAFSVLRLTLLTIKKTMEVTGLGSWVHDLLLCLDAED